MPGTEEQLAWEARQRPRAAIAAILAGLLLIGGGIYSGIVFRDVPQASVLEAYQRAAQPGAFGDVESLRIPLLQWYASHSAELLLAAIVSAAGALAIGGVLTFLAFATGARRAAFPRAVLYLPPLGAFLMAVALILVALGTDATVSDVLDGDRSADAVGDLRGNGLLSTGQLVEVVGRFALGAAFVLVALNAMRVGLLTRFMGVLGIIAGVLLALPVFGGPLPVVQSFWLLALGLLLLGRARGGLLPAWRTGNAEPWPSGVEAREARVAAARGAGAAPDAPPESMTASAPADSAKKKRKRRR